MALLELVEAPWEALEDRLLEQTLPTCRSDPFTERWVIVPSALLRDHLRLQIAAREPGIAGLRFLFPGNAADLVLLRSGGARPAVLSPLARDLLVLRSLERRRRDVSQLTGTDSLPPALVEAVLRTIGDLREAGIGVEELDRLSGGGRGSDGARMRLIQGVYGDYLESLAQSGATDTEGRYQQAAAALGEVSAVSLPAAVWIYGFYDAKAGQTALFNALCEGTEARMLVPYYPETEEYAAGYLTRWRSLAGAHVRSGVPAEVERVAITLPDLRERLVLGRDALDGEGALVAVVSAPGRGREVDQALRLQAAAWQGGLRRDETVVTASVPHRYVRLYAEEANVHGIQRPGMTGAPAPGDGPDEMDLARAIARFLALLTMTASREVAGSAIAAACELEAALAGGTTGSTLGATPVRHMPGLRDLDGWRETLGLHAGREAEGADRLAAEAADRMDGNGDGNGDGVRPRAATRIRRRRERARSMLEAAHLLSRVEEMAGEWKARATWEEWAERLEDLVARFGLRATDPAPVEKVLKEVNALSAIAGEVGPETVLWALGRIESGLAGGADSALPSVMEIRGTRAPLLLVLGMAEGTWPRRPAPDPLLPDSERRSLIQERAWLLPTTAQRALEERLLFRLTLEAGSCTVFLYPRLEEDGTVRRASPHVVGLLHGLQAPGYEEVERAARSGTRTLGQALPAAGEALLGEGDRDLAAVGHLLEGGEAENATVLWTSPWFTAGWQAEMARWRTGIGSWTGILEDAEVVELARGQLFEASEPVVSASLLEEYARCPWRVFTMRVLNLPDQREEPDGLLDPMDLGAILHEVLRAHVEERVEEGQWPPSPGTVEEDEVLLEKRLIQEIGHRYARREGRMPSLERAEVRRAMDRLQGWLRWEASGEEAQGGGDGSGGGRDGDRAPPLSAGSGAGWTAWATEYPFEALLDAGERRVLLKGRWDRADRDGSSRHRLVDYKTGRSRLKPADEVAGGLRLQMPLYVYSAGMVVDEGSSEGGLLVRLGSGYPGAPPQVVAVTRALVEAGGKRLMTLVNLLTGCMENGVYPRWPHPEEEDNRNGLCRGCPTPGVCRGWPKAETMRLTDHVKVRPLHIIRGIDRLEEEE